MDRAEVSRRLKAARWLAGGLDDKGRPVPLSPDELAAREPLVSNGISANAIAEIERMYKDARPMELRELAEALGMAPWWFLDVPIAERVPATQRSVTDLLEALVSQSAQVEGGGAQAPRGALGRLLRDGQPSLQDRRESDSRPDTDDQRGTAG